MLKDVLNKKGVEKLSESFQKKLNAQSSFCKEDGMCYDYGKHCKEMACKEVPGFDINLVSLLLMLKSS